MTEDRGFGQGLATLASTAKRPLLLTANHPQALLGNFSRNASVASVRLGRADVRPEGAAQCVAYLCLVAAAEGFWVRPSAADEVLGRAGGDVRRALLALQSSLTGAAPTGTTAASAEPAAAATSEGHLEASLLVGGTDDPVQRAFEAASGHFSCASAPAASAAARAHADAIAARAEAARAEAVAGLVEREIARAVAKALADRAAAVERAAARAAETASKQAAREAAKAQRKAARTAAARGENAAEEGADEDTTMGEADTDGLAAAYPAAAETDAGAEEAMRAAWGEECLASPTPAAGTAADALAEPASAAPCDAADAGADASAEVLNAGAQEPEQSTPQPAPVALAATFSFLAAESARAAADAAAQVAADAAAAARSAAAGTFSPEGAAATSGRAAEEAMALVAVKQMARLSEAFSASAILQCSGPVSATGALRSPPSPPGRSGGPCGYECFSVCPSRPHSTDQSLLGVLRSSNQIPPRICFPPPQVPPHWAFGAVRETLSRWMTCPSLRPSTRPLPPLPRTAASLA